MTIDTRRGLKRIGIVLTIAWWAYLVYTLIVATRNGPLEIEPGIGPHLWAFAVIGSAFIVPPLLVLAAIAVGKWIWAGFVSKEPEARR